MILYTGMMFFVHWHDVFLYTGTVSFVHWHEVYLYTGTMYFAHWHAVFVTLAYSNCKSDTLASPFKSTLACNKELEETMANIVFLLCKYKPAAC